MNGKWELGNFAQENRMCKIYLKLVINDLVLICIEFGNLSSGRGRLRPLSKTFGKILRLLITLHVFNELVFDRLVDSLIMYVCLCW